MSAMRAIQSGAILLFLAACVHAHAHSYTGEDVPEGGLLGRDSVDLANLTPDQLAALVARQSKDSLRLENVGFPRRAATIQDAYFLAPDDIAAMQPRSLADIFKHVPVPIENPNPTGRRVRGNQSCFFNYVNGIVRRERVITDLETFIHARDVMAVEVYPPGQLPPAPFDRSSYGSNCTTVALWTRS
jgi:hypothetical protein